MIKLDSRITVWCSKELKKKYEQKAKELKVKQSEVGRLALEAFLKIKNK